MLYKGYQIRETNDLALNRLGFYYIVAYCPFETLEGAKEYINDITKGA